MSETKAKPVIALVADGAADPAGQKTLEDLDTLICDKFPEYDVRWAFQAVYMIKAMKARGINTFFERRVPLMSADELLAELAAEGHKNAALQCLMMHQSSFSRNALEADTHGMKVKYGMPFLSAEDNIRAVVATYAPGFGDGVETATVLIGHGVFKDFEYNDCFLKINRVLRENYRNAFLGTLHGPPGIDAVVEEIKKSGCKKVRFISLMMATSEHISKEVMGDEPESWKSRIGLPAEVIDNMGKNSVLTGYFTDSITKLLA